MGEDETTKNKNVSSSSNVPKAKVVVGRKSFSFAGSSYLHREPRIQECLPQSCTSKPLHEIMCVGLIVLSVQRAVLPCLLQ